MKERFLLGEDSGPKNGDASNAFSGSQGLDREVIKKAKSDRSLKGVTRAFSVESNGDVLFKDCPLNEAFVLLAEKTELSFEPNPEIKGEDYLVTGRMEATPDAESACKKFEELAFQYGLKFRNDGKKLEALTKKQVEAYPHEQWAFVLKGELLQATEKNLSDMIRPYLTGSGSLRFDGQNKELLVTDSPLRLEKVEQFIKRIDK